MIRVALAGLIGRKLRTALTALAIVLGVAMVSGTFVLTDSIEKAFNSIYSEVRARLRRRGHRQVRLRPEQQRPGHVRADVRPSRCSDSCARCPDVQAAQGSVAETRTSLVTNGKAIAFGGAPNLGFSVIRGSPFNPLTLVDGLVADGAARSWSTRSTASQEASDGRPDDRRAGRRSGRAVPHLGHRQVRRASSASAARRSRASTCRQRSASSTSRGSSTRSRSPASRASPPEELLKQVEPILPPTAQARTGAGAGGQGRDRTPTRSSPSCTISCSRSAASRSSSAAS